jgi:glutamate synthase domain-containing protein 3
MTNGTVVILGATGKNFGAGMTGGVAYVLDLEDSFPIRYNQQLVSISRLADAGDIAALKALIQRHLDYTGSPRANEVLGNWDGFQPKFWKVSPNVPTAKPVEKPAKQGEKTGAVISEDVTASR